MADLNKKTIRRVNLQLFAESSGEKTEKATPKRREDARKKGQVIRSKDLTVAIIMIVTIAGIRIFGGTLVGTLNAYIHRMLEERLMEAGTADSGWFGTVLMEMLYVMAQTILPLLIIALLATLVVEFAQVGFIFSAEALGFKFDRINPIAGIKRMFSLRSVVELLKSILKVLFIGWVGYAYLMGEQDNMLRTMQMTPLSSAYYITSTAFTLAMRICASLIIIAVADYVYQWWDYEKSLRMTKQEIKEEYKQIEGNPEIKGKIKQKQRQMSMKRMMQSVPKADVVITNPTHYAIGLKYDQSQNPSPICVAKGVDYMAQRIKDIAREHDVPIVENRELARALHASVDIDEAIPPELFAAVAEVLAFVYKLKGRR